MNDTQLLIDRIDNIEKNMKAHLDLNLKLVFANISTVDTKAIKAHDRLDEHSKSISCLTRYKNRGIGAISVISIVLTVLGGYVILN